MSNSGWGPLIQWTFWGVAMTVVMGWVRRSRDRARPQDVEGELRHPPATLVTGLVCGVAFAAMAVAAAFARMAGNRTAGPWVIALFVGFAAMSAAMVADYCFGRHLVDADGMRFRRMLGQRGSFRWADLRTVAFRPSMKWFVLTLADGRKVRVSAMLRGLPGFARLLLAHAPQARCDASTATLLRSTAEGRPPSVWL